MIALVRCEEGIRWRTVSRREPTSNEVEVQIRLVGLCRTDLAVANGAIPVCEPRILGHECVGEVVSLGSGVDKETSRIAVGDNVALHPVIACESCRRCQSGWHDACENRQFIGVDVDGAISQTIVVPARNCWEMPIGMDDRVAAMLEPVAACAAVTNAPIETNMRGLILGSGRLEKLTERILYACGFAAVERLESQPEEDRYDFAIDTHGSTDSLLNLARALKPRGHMVLKSRPVEPPLLDLRSILAKEPSLHAVNYVPFANARRFLVESPLDITDLLGPIWSADKAEDAFAAAELDHQHKHFVAIPQQTHEIEHLTRLSNQKRESTSA